MKPRKQFQYVESSSSLKASYSPLYKSLYPQNKPPKTINSYAKPSLDPLAIKSGFNLLYSTL